MKTALRHLPSFLGPGLLLFLLAIQVAAGLNGFRGSENGLLRLLEVPGVLLGWGGVALLLPLLLWMLLDWWGYTPSGFALKSLGAMSLGVASAAVAGLIGGQAGGGVVGSALAELLGDTLGTPIAAILLVAMAAPAAVLAFSRLGVQHLRAVAAAPPAAPKGGTPKKPSKSGARSTATSGGFSLSAALARIGEAAREAARKSVAWIPRRGPAVASDLEALARSSAAKRQAERVAATEGVRYADEPDAPLINAPLINAAPAAEDTPEHEEPALPSIVDVLTGKYEGADLESDPVYEDVARPDYVTRETRETPQTSKAATSQATTDTNAPDAETADDEPDDDGPIHVDAEGNIVRSAPIRPAPSPVVRTTRDESPDREVTHIGESGPPASLRLRREGGEGTLPAGVRWADQPIESRVESRVESPGDAQAAQPASDAHIGADPVEADPARPEHEPEGPASGIRPARDVSPQPTRHKSTSDDDVGVPRDLPRAEPLVLDALRGTTAQRAARRQASRRPGETRNEERNVVRTALKDSLTALAQTGARESQLKKLEATGLFDLDADKKQRSAASALRQPEKTPQSATGTSGSTNSERSDSKPVMPEPAQRELSPMAKAEAARRAAQKALVHQLRGDDRDPQFADAVELALQRGSVSLVLLSRRLRTSYARSRALLDRLVSTDVVAKANDNGGHKTLLTGDFWAEVQGLVGD